MSVDIPGCTNEIAATMLGMLSTREPARTISSRYYETLPHLRAADVVLELATSYGSFPKLTATQAPWSEVGLSDEGRSPLYKIISRPDCPPSYFTIINNQVRRIQPPKQPRR